MKDEEMKQEAEEYAKENYCDEVRATARNAYLDCARLKEKRIAELKKENGELEKKYKAKITQAHIDGYNRGKAEQEKENAEIRKKVIDIFANDEMQQGELWKACGLRLVGWDYEKNQLDDRFMVLYGVSN